MKIALILFATLVCVNSFPFFDILDIGTLQTVIESAGTVNGVEQKNSNELNNKAEQVIRGLIDKHLNGEWSDKKNYQFYLLIFLQAKKV